MGLLDPKTRIMDVILTEEGRVHLSRGKLQIAYAAFSDGATYYEADSLSGSSDVTARVYFEANSLPQDRITFQADDSGHLKPFPNPTGINVISGKIVSGSSIVPTEGQQFASMAGKLLGSSMDNFKNLHLIGTIDDMFEDELFEVNVDMLDFVVTNNNPTPASRITAVNVANIPTFLEDPRMSHTHNYKYLPPVIRSNKEQTLVRMSRTVPLAVHADESSFIESYAVTLAALEKMGAHHSITMDPTSHDNNIMMQMFEVQPDGTMIKLDVLAFESQKQADKNMYFVGKIIQDNDEFKFVNIFTLVLS